MKNGLKKTKKLQEARGKNMRKETKKAVAERDRTYCRVDRGQQRAKKFVVTSTRDHQNCGADCFFGKWQSGWCWQVHGGGLGKVHMHLWKR